MKYIVAWYCEVNGGIGVLEDDNDRVISFDSEEEAEEYCKDILIFEAYPPQILEVED